MKSLFHHIKRHGKKVHSHVRKHHKKYIFGLISSAVLYKFISIIATTIFSTSILYSFASGTILSGEELTGTFSINNEAVSTTGLDVILNNDITGATHMRFADNETDLDYSAWEVFLQTKSWTLSGTNTGIKIVYAEFSGNSGTIVLQDSIEYLPELLLSGDITPNTTPDVLLQDISGANIDTEYTSDVFTMSGINTGILVTIANGLYKINDGDWTSDSSMIFEENTIQFKGTSSAQYSSDKEIYISLGDLDLVWIISTSETNNICDLGDIEILSPISGDILKGEFDILLDYNNQDCLDDNFIIKLWDANTQYITVGTSDYNNTGLSFDSSLLYSGFYNITGLNTSGDTVVIYTGEHTGLNTTYFSGHKLVIYNDELDVLYEGDIFTIDNENPSITGISIDIDNTNTGYVGLGDEIILSFVSSEEFSGASVNILGKDAILVNNSGSTYEYAIILSSENTQGDIIYNIEFEDLAGNTGYYEGSLDLYFDKSHPLIESFEITKTGNYLDFTLETNEISKLNFVYLLSGSSTGVTYESPYLTSHNYIFTGLENEYYNYTLSIKDLAENMLYLGGYFKFTGDNINNEYSIINSGDMFVGAGFTTGSNAEILATTGKSFIEAFRQEIDKFNVCRDNINNIKDMEIPVGSYNITLKMPKLSKSYVRKLVSAFSIVLFDKIEEVGLYDTAIDKIASEFNDFLIILKLVQDDDNQCEQNLSNYYMSKFRKSLIKYDIAQ